MGRFVCYLKCRLWGIALLATALAGCASRGGGPIDQAAARDAKQLHALLRPAVVDERDARLKTYLDQVGARITTAARDLASRHDGPAGEPPVWLTNGDARFHIVSDDLPNAFTFSGTHVYISSALFARCEAEDDLAAALCHAAAHAYTPRLMGEPGAEVDVVREVVALRRPASVDSAVDDIGFALYARAGWEPARYDAMLRALAGARETTARLAQARQRVDALPARADEWRQTPVADPRRFASLRLEAKALVPEMSRDRQARLLIEAMPNCFLPADPPELARARSELIPPPTAIEDNPWGKGPRPKPTP